MAWDTAANIINDAAVEVGLAPVADPFASTDPNFVLLCRLLKIYGRTFQKDVEWTQLRMEHTFNTISGIDEYELPDDFDRMVDQTGWNRTADLPLDGPLTAQVWQSLQAQGVGVSLTLAFRKASNLILITPTPTSSQEVKFEYQSSWWVQPTTASEPTLDAPTASTDKIWFDGTLMSHRLRMQFLKAKNLPATDAERDYLRIWNRVQGADRPAAKLSMNAKGSSDRLLDSRNIPLTGFGA